MKLKLDFSNKVPKEAKDNEIILVKDKASKNKIVKSLSKSLFKNKLFLEKKFFVQNIKDKNYVFELRYLAAFGNDIRVHFRY